LLAGVVDRVDGDFAETLVGVGLRVISHGVGVAEIFADVFEGFHLLLPGLGEIGFAAGALGDALEDVAGDGILVYFGGGDDIERNSFVLGDGAHVVGRHHAGVVRTVGEDDDDLSSRDLGRIAQ